MIISHINTSNRLVSVYLALIALLIPMLCHAQNTNCEFSKPLKLKQQGKYRVLCMKNGNTMLFHIDAAHSIAVKVFDSNRIEIGGSSDEFKILDEFNFNRPVLEAIFEINGEAVLFIEQERHSKHCLIRLRYNATTGKLTEENMIAESASANKRMHFHVMQNEGDDNYQVFFCMYIRHPRKTEDMFVVYFNNKHEALKEVQLDLDAKKYDYLEVLDATALANGTLITLGLDKTKIHGIPAHEIYHPVSERSAVYDHYVSYYFIPKNDTAYRKCTIDVSETVFPKFTFSTYNPFANTLNSLLFSYHPFDSSFAMNGKMGVFKKSLFFKIALNEDMPVSFNSCNERLANDFLQQQTNNTIFFDGPPKKMYTNENGLTTVISIAKTKFADHQTEDQFANASEYMGITQLDDDGNEIWATVLPMLHYYIPKFYEMHFPLFKSIYWNNNFYIVFNDYDINLENTLKDPGKAVYYYNSTNTFYYKIDSKRKITKQYLYGKLPPNEYKSSLVAASGFDMNRGTFATLIQHQKKGKTTMHMAWSRLE